MPAAPVRRARMARRNDMARRVGRGKAADGPVPAKSAKGQRAEVPLMRRARRAVSMKAVVRQAGQRLVRPPGRALQGRRVGASSALPDRVGRSDLVVDRGPHGMKAGAKSGATGRAGRSVRGLLALHDVRAGASSVLPGRVGRSDLVADRGPYGMKAGASSVATGRSGARKRRPTLGRDRDG